MLSTKVVIFPVNWMSNGEKKGDKTTGNNNQHDHCVHAGTAEGMKVWGREGGHCVLKWILHGHFKPPPNAAIQIIFEVISIKFW